MEKSSASAAMRHEQQSAVENRSRSSTDSSLVYHRPQVLFDNQTESSSSISCVCLSGFCFEYTTKSVQVQPY